MEKYSQHFEKLLRNSLSKSELSPSSQVLRKLRFKLWVADFFSANLRKFNILYASMMVTGVILAVLSADDSQPAVAEPAKIEVAEKIIAPVENDETEVAIVEEPFHSEERPTVEMLMPTADFEASISAGCAPLTVEFKNLSRAADTYEWEFGNGEVFTDDDAVFTFNDPGRYQAKLTVTNKNGNKDTYTKDIEVYQVPVAAIDIDLDKSDLSEKKVHFINQSEGAGTYSWFFGDKLSSRLTEPVHTYREYKSYDVMMIARSDQGCADTATLNNTFIEKDYRLAFNDFFRPYLHGKSGDGYYDRARSDASIYGPRHNGVLEYELTIRSPKGNVVFKTNTIKQGWNGYIEGRLASQGTYSYEAVGKYPNGQAFKQTGKFRVILEDIY